LRSIPLKAARAGEKGFDGVAVERFHPDGVGGGVKHHLAIRPGERAEHDALGDSVERDDLIERRARRPALERLDWPADRDVNLQGAQAFPEPMPAGRGDRQVD
jgi:hypothetical protein